MSPNRPLTAPHLTANASAQAHLPSASALLQLQHLGVGYAGTGAKPVLSELSFSLQPGSITCLLGANGCGKTTLIKTLLGQLAPLQGQVLLAGQPLPEYTPKALAQRIGYVPQSQALGFAFSVQDMVLMGRSAHLRWFAAPSLHDKQLAAEALHRLGIGHLERRNYHELSGGERQLVLIARALVQQTDILIMDEPTASLDYGNQLRILAQIEALRHAGLSILLTTHQPEHAHQIADHVVLLHAGRALAQGARAACLTASHLACIYGLDEATLKHHLHWL